MNHSMTATNCPRFFFTSAARQEQIVLAQKPRLLKRYYIWPSEGAWQPSSRLHYDLIDRKVAPAE